MKKRILGLLVVLSLIIPVMPVAATEVSQDNENVNRTFSDIDGGEITTQSEGRPKLLIFFGKDCGNCKAALRDISSSEWIRTGETDVCAIEVWAQNTEDDVRTFRDTYCPEGTIRFAAGRSDGLSTADTYHVAAGNPPGSKFTTPLIAMIDAENKVRYVTTGPITADEVETYLPSLGVGSDDSQKPDETPGGNVPDGAGKPTTPDQDKPTEDSKKKDDTKPDAIMYGKRF